jgi:hypothetical protein
MIRRPASLHAVPRCVSEFPRFTGEASPPPSVLSGRCDFPPPVPPRFVSFAWRCRRRVRALRSLRLANARAGGPGLVGVRPARAEVMIDGDGRISQVPGEPPLHLRRALRPRQDQRRLTDRNALARPPRRERRGLLHCRFRGSIPRLRCSLSTLRPGGHPPRTQDSLPAAGQALPGGLRPAGFLREVSEWVVTSHPPLPSLLGAIPHSGQRPGVARRS